MADFCCCDFAVWEASVSVKWCIEVILSIGLKQWLASFDVALLSDCEKQSWINLKIEIFPSTRWVLLGWFPAHRSCFEWAIAQLLCTTIHDINLTSCAYVLLLQPQGSAAQICVRTAAGPSSLWLCISQWNSKQNRSRNRDFLKFCLVGPHVGPEA